MDDEINGLSMYILKYSFWKAVGYSLRHFSLKSFLIYLRARLGRIQCNHILKWSRRQHLLVIPYEDGILSKAANNKKILDCGCGLGYWGYKIFTNGRSESIIGLDVYKRYLLITKRLKVYENLILASAAALPFRETVFDLIIAPELIEHLTKQDGERFFRQASEIAKKILITSPARYFEVNSSIHSERHHSFWSEEELRKHGFSTEKHDEITIAFLSR